MPYEGGKIRKKALTKLILSKAFVEKTDNDFFELEIKLRADTNHDSMIPYVINTAVLTPGLKFFRTTQPTCPKHVGGSPQVF